MDVDEDHNTVKKKCCIKELEERSKWARALGLPFACPKMVNQASITLMQKIDSLP